MSINQESSCGYFSSGKKKSRIQPFTGLNKTLSHLRDIHKRKLTLQSKSVIFAFDLIKLFMNELILIFLNLYLYIYVARQQDRGLLKWATFCSTSFRVSPGIYVRNSVTQFVEMLTEYAEFIKMAAARVNLGLSKRTRHFRTGQKKYI